MNFTINVDIDLDEVTRKVAEKAEKEAYALVDARCQKRIDQIIQGYAPLETKLKKFAEERVIAYMNNLVDEMFDIRWSPFGIRGERTQKIKEFLGAHLADKMEEIMDGVELTSHDIEDQVIEAVAERLTRETRMTKSVIRRLAEEIVNIQEKGGANE